MISIPSSPVRDRLSFVGIEGSTSFPLRKSRSSIASSRRIVQKKQHEQALVIVRIRRRIGVGHTFSTVAYFTFFFNNRPGVGNEMRTMCKLERGSLPGGICREGGIAFLKSKYPKRHRCIFTATNNHSNKYPNKRNDRRFFV